MVHHIVMWNFKEEIALVTTLEKAEDIAVYAKHKEGRKRGLPDE